MKEITQILATTHIDRENDRFTREALEDIVRKINACHLPWSVEHDPRIPPQGRVRSARLIQLQDGAYAVEGVIEVFEDGDRIELQDSRREIPVEFHSPDSLAIFYDKGFVEEEAKSLVLQIANVLSAEPKELVKKSLDPASVLIIAGAFAVGAIATGFFNKIGSDSWDLLKRKLGSLYSARTTKSADRLLLFQVTLSHGETRFNLETILTNPSPQDIELFLDKGLRELDSLSSELMSESSNLRRIVCEYDNGHLRVLFGVRKDAWPVMLRSNSLKANDV